MKQYLTYYPQYKGSFRQQHIYFKKNVVEKINEQIRWVYFFGKSSIYIS